MLYSRIRISIFFACLGSMLLLNPACQSGTDGHGDKEAVEEAVPVVKHDWTGTYYFADEGAETAYQLKLHKRSVDGSYEMQYMKGVEGNKNYYPEYMFDAKDGDSSICIRFMGSFTAEEKDWPFKKGDTMFVLSLNSDNKITTDWRSVKPKGLPGTFTQISKDYH